MHKILRKILISILEIEARFVLEKYKPKVIAITGSVGKTSTKDAIYGILSESFFVRKSLMGLESSLEIPLTVLGCEASHGNLWGNIRNIIYGLELIIAREPYPEYLILEVSVRRPGEIDRILRWLKTDIIVFTRFGSVPSYIEFFDKIDDMVNEKYKLTKTLSKNGIIFVNADDSHSMSIKERFAGKSDTFGFNKNASIRSSNPQIAYTKGHPDVPCGIIFGVETSTEKFPVVLNGALGTGHVYAALAGLSIAKYLGLNIATMSGVFSNYELPSGRMRLLPGVKGCTIIDDTYNSSPSACETAVKTMDDIKCRGKKILALGDMLELGNHTKIEHENIGKLAGKVADILVCVGLRARDFIEGALTAEMSEKNIFHFENAKSAGAFLQGLVQKGDVVLIKGSQAVRMENAVAEIMAYPEDAQDVLVRQN